MKIEISIEEFQKLLNLVDIVPTGYELPDYEDISELELATDFYAEEKGETYPVTVRTHQEIIQRLKDLYSNRMVERKK